MRRLMTTLTLLLAASLLGPAPSQAGCGCDKPAPAPSAVRPRVTYPGTEVTIFDTSIVAGQHYDIELKNRAAKATASVTALAVLRRDLADGKSKPQLVFTLPALPPGPTAIKVSPASKGRALFAVDEAGFTVAAAPIALSNAVGPLTVSAKTAAVSSSGVVYLSLDLTGITQPRVFEVQLQGYPLTFGAKDVLFYNRQGFLMQTLGEGMPGLFTISKPTQASNSDVLRYSRHEFNTYFLQHVERTEHAVDPTDPNWHLDGTPHIDHDHLIVAIVGTLRDGTSPSAGETSSFDVSLGTYTVFHHGLVGQGGVTLAGEARTASYDSVAGTVGTRGDVRSNGVVNVTEQSVVDGNAASGVLVNVAPTATVTGQIQQGDAVVAFLPVSIPKDIPDLGALTVTAGTTQTLGRGTYRTSGLVVEPDATLAIDNANGPVTLYVDGDVVVGGTVTTVGTDPENFAIYVAGMRTVVLNSDADFNGLVHAPSSIVDVSGLGQFNGAFVGGSVEASGEAAIHFDTALRGGYAATGIPTDAGQLLGGGSSSLLQSMSSSMQATSSSTTSSSTSYSVPVIY